ncbi:MAG TPA: hypothetical protein VGV89_04190 [Thermoplasmata archaeon]|nr:hypothetical protein [Thermoplasmata archaeon]
MAVVILLGSAFAAPVATTIYKAPFTGQLYSTHSKVGGGCHTLPTSAYPSLALSTGKVVSSAGVSVSATSCLKPGSSYAKEKFAEGVELTPFILKPTGTYKISATWKLNFRMTVSLRGSSCGDSGQFAAAAVLLQAIVVNTSNGSVPYEMAHFGEVHDALPSTSFSKDFARNESMTWVSSFGSGDYYQIGTFFSIVVVTQVDNSVPGDTDTCAAAASVTPLSGSTLATLREVVVV